MKYPLALENQSRFLPLLFVFAGVSGIIMAIAPYLLDFGNQHGWGNRQLALVLCGITIVLTGLVLLSSNNHRYIGQWSLLVAGVIAVVFAADLLVVYGLPGFRSKQFVVASVMVGLILTHIIQVTTINKKQIREGVNLIINEKITIGKYLSIVVQLGLIVLVMRQFQIENQAFYHNIMLVTFYGFLIHSLLPMSLRLPFFLLISYGAILGIFGLINGLWLIGIGLLLIAICFIPISFRGRVITLLLTGAVLAVTRAQWLEVPWSSAIWPILGSMFMFRLIAFMYDLKHQKEPVNFTTTLSYFFLLPNVVAPLFPIIDFNTFRRKYFDDDQFHVYQKGIQFIVWGVIHLILYRFINYYLVLAPENVHNFSDLLQYLTTSFLLLLRVSGKFHVAIGILHLFGFNLPRVMREYFLASSFNDLWRRANIYWKDFMLKVFYYPTYFQLRKLGPTYQLILATILVYIVTWFLHAYQWFWLRGEFLLTPTDISFWAIFGFCVLINSLYETRFRKKKSLSNSSWSFRETTIRAIWTLATFSAISILWSLWISASFAEWFSLWSVAFIPPESILSLTPYFIGASVIVAMVFWRSRDHVESAIEKIKNVRFFKHAAMNTGLIAFILLLGSPSVYSRMGGQTQELISDLRISRLSDREADMLFRGYYENLIGVNLFNADLWDIYTRRPADWPLLQDTEIAQLTDDFIGFKFEPSRSIMFHGAQLSTNRWGMRDRDYSLTPTPNTHRIALLGPSFVMGSGVADNEVMDWLLEERMNHEYKGNKYSNIEILNFGFPGTSAIQQLAKLEEDVLAFEPDALFFVAHPLEEHVLARNLANRMRTSITMPYTYLDEIAQEAGIVEGMTQVEAERRLQPFSRELVSWTYNRVVEVSIEREILPIWVFIATLDENENQDPGELIHIANQAGFITIDLSKVYAGYDIEALIVAEWDRHPNARAHRILADQLYLALKENVDAYSEIFH
jgi:hypothetical protein